MYYFHDSWLWECVACMPSGAWITSSNHRYVADFAGGMIILKQMFARNKPCKHSHRDRAAKMECKRRNNFMKIAIFITFYLLDRRRLFLLGLLFLLIRSTFWRTDSNKCCRGPNDIPLVRSTVDSCSSPGGVVILGFVNKMLLHSLSEKGCFQNGWVG